MNSFSNENVIYMPRLHRQATAKSLLVMRTGTVTVMPLEPCVREVKEKLAADHTGGHKVSKICLILKEVMWIFDLDSGKAIKAGRGNFATFSYCVPFLLPTNHQEERKQCSYQLNLGILQSLCSLECALHAQVPHPPTSPNFRVELSCIFHSHSWLHLSL